jgi:hypothetical protein
VSAHKFELMQRTRKKGTRKRNKKIFLICIESSFELCSLNIIAQYLVLVNFFL